MSSAAVQHQQPSSHGHDQYYQQPAPAQTSPMGHAARLGALDEPSALQPSQHRRSPSNSNTSDVTGPRPLPKAPVAANQAPVPPPRTSSIDRTSSKPIQDAGRSSFHAVQAPARSHSATAVGMPSAGPSIPREESIVLSRTVITDPAEDIARAQARIDEARPSEPSASVAQAAGLESLETEGVDGGRSRAVQRSRQDDSRERRRETKFGEYILGQTLGEGEFGKVKMGWKKPDGVQVAIKLIRRETLGSNPHRLPKIYREISILRGLQHPNIVRLHEVVETERHIGIILEYASGGELFDYILNNRYLKDTSARRLFAQLVSGVGYLHKKGIVHRDLKLENLLLDRNKNIIITDFGFANNFDANDPFLNKDIPTADLERKDEEGPRRGDLMQTSCGSPCYAAPELVVNDQLYTGRKVDVWSCGVILYAMLAGYLPFDDDPANPEGDNINLLYKYITSTPLTFPEYVTPHARDLLKRILVPDPRRRADLFEVARHSWLSEYAHILSSITSSTTTTTNDVGNATVPPERSYEPPQLSRSVSVREATKPPQPHYVGGLTAKHGHIDGVESPDRGSRRDAKRRTVQVEYVAPHTQTQRGSDPLPQPTAGQHHPPPGPAAPVQDAPRPRKGPRATSDSPHAGSPVTAATATTATTTTTTTPTTTRPSTSNGLGGSSRLPSRGNSYGQPAAATVATTNAQGRFSQPKSTQYVISHEQRPDAGAPPTTITRQAASSQRHQSSHKRSPTVMGIGDRFFRASVGSSQKAQKSHPPISMNNPMHGGDGHGSRKSTESNRRPSLGFSRKTSDSVPSRDRSSRRFSLLPASFSMKSFTSGQRTSSRPQMTLGHGDSSPSPSQSTGNTATSMAYDGGVTMGPPPKRRTRECLSMHSTHFQPQQYPDNVLGQYPSIPDQGNAYHLSNDTDLSSSHAAQPQSHRLRNAPYESADATVDSREGRARSLQKNRRFADAYEDSQRHAGSSGAARRVMDLFRRRGKARGG